MIEVSEQGYSGQEDSAEERKYDILHNMVRNTDAGLENTFSHPSLTWQEMQIFKKITLNVYNSSAEMENCRKLEG